MGSNLLKEKRRLLILVVFFSLLFILIIIRLFKLSVIDSIKTDNNKKTLSIYERGEILDAYYKKLALSIKIYSVFCNSSEIEEIEESKIDKIVSYLKIDKKRLQKIFVSKKRFVWLKRQIDYNTLKKILNLKVKGIYYLREYKRFYPNGRLCSHVLGITGIDNVGLEGLELYYDKYLNSGVNMKKDTGKLNLVLSIDKNFQYIVENELRKIVKKTRAKGGIVIVMEPSTGYVIAMASIDDFDPNYFYKYSQKTRRNRSVLDIFEPGSVFKIFSIAAVYSEKVVKKGEKFYCPGHVVIGDKKINCSKKHGSLDFHKVVKLSCNVGMIKSVLRISRFKFYNYLRNFGIGNYTGIDLPGEARGYLRNPKGMGLFSQAAISLGQEVGTTAIQLITAACSIYNDGKLMEPKFVKAIIYNDGTIYKKFDPTFIRQAVPPNIARMVREDLKGVVAEGGTGQLAYIKNFPIGGKTGTGQIFNKKLGKYEKGKVNSSFIGFFPADKARYGILVTINAPKTESYTGGKVAAPVFKNIVEKIISYKAIPNKNIISPGNHNILKTFYPAVKNRNLNIIPDLLNKNMREVIQVLRLYKVKMNLVGTGIAYKQTPKKLSKIRKGMIVTVWFEEP